MRSQQILELLRFASSRDRLRRELDGIEYRVVRYSTEALCVALGQHKVVEQAVSDFEDSLPICPEVQHRITARSSSLKLQLIRT
jgi:hypothetical protein